MFGRVNKGLVRLGWVASFLCVFLLHPLSAHATFQPYAIRLDSSDNIFVSDVGASKDYEISNTTGAILHTYSGLNGAYGLELDGAGNLFASSFGFVHKLSIATGNEVSPGPYSASGFFSVPAAIVYDGSGNIYVADIDQYQIYKIDLATGNVGHVYDISGVVCSPDDLALDGSGNVYVADSNCTGITKISLATEGVQATYGVPANYITSVRLGPNGNLFAGDFVHKNVIEFDPVTGAVLHTYTGGATFLSVNGIAFDSLGNLYVVDSSGGKIVKINTSNNTTIATYTGTSFLVPGAPTSVSATAGNATSTVTFVAPVSNGGTPVTGYTVISSPAGGTDSNAGSTTLSHIMTGLTNGTAYTFTAVAVNAVGTSTASSASNSVTPVGLPGAPTAVSAVAGNTQATISFTAPASNGGSAITSYTVTSSPGGFTGTGSASPIIVTGLTNGTPYTFTVTATNAVGTSTASGASSAVTPIATVPGAPTSVSAVAGNATSTVTFVAPLNNGGSPITGYTVYSSAGGTDSNAGSTSTSHLITGLTNGISYTFAVTATNGIGASALSASSTVVIPMTVPGAPRFVSATGGGNAQSTVTFTAPISNGGSAITLYTVVSTPGSITATGSASPITITGLTNGTAYTFKVKATNVVGTGSASSASSSITPSSVPDAPTITSFTVGDSSALVYFNAPASNGGSAITLYTVSTDIGGITVTGSSSPILVSGLTNNLGYRFTVSATNATGAGPSSSQSSLAMPTNLVSSNDSWYNSSWARRSSITINGTTAGVQTNYQVKINVSYVTGMRSDFGDIRFTDLDGTTALNYWMESKVDGVSAVFWVKVPSIPVSPNHTSIFMYYGNTFATSLSNGDATFPLFDTFGSGNTPGDWNWSYDTIGEHGVVKNGKLYLPLDDRNNLINVGLGLNSGLGIFNPADGTILKHFSIPSNCLQAAPAIDIHGYIHMYSCDTGFIKKIDENVGVIRTLTVNHPVDLEAVSYDPITDSIVYIDQGMGMRAIRATDYSTIWTNTDVTTLINGSVGYFETPPVLIAGGYAYWQDFGGRVFKVSMATGATVASTTATIASTSPSSVYAQIIYDSANDRIYVTNQANTVFALRASNLSTLWSISVDDIGWNLYRGSAYHNNVLYVTDRETSGLYRSKIYAINSQNGNVLWSTKSGDTFNDRLGQLLVDDDYVYVDSITDLVVFSILDGSIVESIPLHHGPASSVPVFYGGKYIKGLWDTHGYQAIQVRSGGGTGDYMFKADSNMTGYVGAFSSGPLTPRIACDYLTLDATKWTASSLYSLANCSTATITNLSSWTNYISSNSTFSRSGTAIRVKAKSAEATSNSYDTAVGYTNAMGTAAPVLSGQYNGNIVFTYNQNGVTATTTGLAYVKDQYNTTEIKMAYPRLQFDVNDTNITDIGNWTTSYNNVPVSFGNYSSRSVFDWALVRTYAYPEPTVSLGSEVLLHNTTTGGGGSIVGLVSSGMRALSVQVAPSRPQIITPDGKVTYTDTPEARSTPPVSSAGSVSIASPAVIPLVNILVVPTQRDITTGSAPASDIRTLQQFLNAQGFTVATKGVGAPGHETTIFGENTKKALIKFQKANSLPATGYFGPKTRAVIGRMVRY